MPVSISLVLTAILLVAAPFGFEQTARGVAVDEPRRPITDRERDGLRGPVRTSTEEWDWPGSGTHPPAKTSITWEYDREGRILSRASASDTSDWITRYSYTPEGKLGKVASGKADGPQTETTYSYDGSGRIARVSGADDETTTFQYDDHGRKSSIRTAGPKRADVAYAGRYDGSDADFRLTTEGLCNGIAACVTVKISYNDQDRPTEAEFRTAEGQVITRLVRAFDDKGNVTSEQTVDEKPELMLPADLGKELNPAQMATMGKVFASMCARSASFVYDSEGRLTESRIMNPLFGGETRTVTYNEHGDTAEERVRRTGSPGFSGSVNEQGVVFPGTPTGATPPEQSDTRHLYQYDEYGNWTERTTQMRSNPDEPFRMSTRHRKLTYYPAK